MKILLLSPVPLGRGDQGVKLRGEALQRAVERLAQVEVLCFDAGPGDRGDVPLPPPPGDLERLVSWTPSLVRCFRSKLFGRHVRAAAPACQACFCLGLQMMQYASQIPEGRPVILDNFNVESDILRGLSRQREGLKRYYWRWQAWKLRRFERWALSRADLALAISHDDRWRFQELVPRARVQTVAPGLRLERYLALPGPPRGGYMVFVGALDWHVNIEAARWLVTRVWPRIRSMVPSAELHLVGRSPAPEVRALTQVPGVALHPDVPSVLPYLEAASVVVAPLRFGSGVQTKVVEALATARPVVATPIAAQGLEVLPGRDLLVAEEAEDFAQACARVLLDASLAGRLGQSGREAVRHRYSFERLEQEVGQLLTRATNRRFAREARSFQ